MTRTASWLLSIGVLLFVGVLLSQDLPAILTTLGHAGWGLLLRGAFSLTAAGHRCRGDLRALPAGP